ncbi:MAG: Asp-tRNA(Asn)/Glu-tRNA(Gln) amidotransferase subunit GatC [Rickettsiales bacterium]|jgi:aspartyl-tRNA(Asn)/glutamyl-tRNA(Gln) amidotransferase subunit C|nr:Asp-tRNA(Asn)/Glu-tRNA(Gln) amidotransferase subunit GatC [Rickettsiales bacterium]
MYFNKEKVKANAKMVRIGMPDTLAERMIPELESVLEWIKVLDEVDVSGVEPISTTAEFPLPRRADVINDGDIASEILANAPAPDPSHEFFTVPKIIEGE